VSYHRVSPEDYEGNPWFQDDRTGMFFQFLQSDWSSWRPPTPTPAEVARDILHRYGSAVAAHAAWSGRPPNWYTEESADADPDD